jgi:hypothetical protein
MIDETTADVLGDNTSDHVVEEAVVPLPPPPPEKEQVLFAMAHGEQFTRDQYLEAGWTDEQLLAAKKMTAVGSAQILAKGVGMPNATWVVLDDNDDIPPTGLFVGHNGTGFLIQTGIPVCVPNHVLGVLDDAIMAAPVIDPTSRQITGYRERPRYTYRKVDAPVAAG